MKSKEFAAQKRKANRMKAFLSNMMSEEVPKDFKPVEWSPKHRTNSNVIFAAAMYVDLEASSIKQFCGTARKYGFDGDIVVAVYDGTAEKLQKHFISPTWQAFLHDGNAFMDRRIRYLFLTHSMLFEMKMSDG